MSNNYTPLDRQKLKNFFSPSPDKEVEPPKPREIVFEEKTEYEIKEQPHITIRPESIKLPSDLKKIGLQPTPPLKTSVFNTVKLPISDEKIVTGLHKPVTSSLRWLATLAVYLLKMSHLQLKVIHGKVVRVFKN